MLSCNCMSKKFDRVSKSGQYFIFVTMFHIFEPDAAVVYSWLLYLNDLITKPDQLSQLKTVVELELNKLSFISISIFYLLHFYFLISVSFVCAQRAYYGHGNIQVSRTHSRVLAPFII